MGLGHQMARKASSRRRQRGNIAVVSALAMLPIALVIANGANLVEISRLKASLQAAADAGALAGAGELGVVTRGNDGIIQTAVNFANTSAQIDISKTPSVFTATVDDGGGSVTVKGSYRQESVFGRLAGGTREITVTATAEALRNMPLCILQSGGAGEAVSSQGVTLSDNAIIRAPGCLVQANHSISVHNSARIEAGLVNAAGTAVGQILPVGNAGAMPITDPFMNLNLTPKFNCPKWLPEIKHTGNVVLTLPPGVHCGKFILTGNVKLHLAPGEHYFMDKLEFAGNSMISGEDVVLIFGSDDSFSFGEKAEVRLSARKSGPFAGFLIATTRDNTQLFTISSDRVRELLGTIYIPNAELMISTRASVAEESAWSVIVAKKLTLVKDPVLVINKNYLSSNVPVPKGVGPSAGVPRLSQ